MRLLVGCSGFSYSAWSGHFYPPELPNSNWLSYYSKVFDFVEIDSTFYRIPNVVMTRKWSSNTPDDFRFAAKMPGALTHEKRLGEGIDASLRYFYEVMMPLKEKVASILIQLPPSLTKSEGFDKFKKMVLDDRFRHALEVRHESWFDDEVYEYLKQNNICLAWSQLAELRTPPVLTTDFAYLRLIGYHSIPDSIFGKVRSDRVKELRYWASQLKRVKGVGSMRLGIVAANNHYAGFGAATANTFRKMIDLPEGFYYKKAQFNQSTLLDYQSD